MYYTLAYLDLDRFNQKIQIIDGLSEEDVVRYLMDLTGIELDIDMGVDVAGAEIDYQIADHGVYVGNIYLTVANHYGKVVYQL